MTERALHKEVAGEEMACKAWLAGRKLPERRRQSMAGWKKAVLMDER